MSWVPFINPDPAAECQVCFDYGGLLNDEEVDHEGMPLMESCTECPKYQRDAYGYAAD